MGHTHEDKAKAIFEAVVDLPPAVRAERLDDLCEGADDLKRSVEALIRSHESATEEGFLAEPAVERPRSTSSTSVGERPGDMIGPYKLLQVIGKGGFGVVFMAEQKEPVKRRVALKIIKHGMDTKQVVARFEAERQALALMDHPNIARVLDGGSTDRGRPYFVMDLVKGVEITQYCDENKLDVRERLALFGDVCRAIQHAHQKGVIHRDLKPSNILVAIHDGKPVPTVIDFGIAKATNTELTSKTLFTEYGQMIGTPAYMSPEQAEMSGLDIDTRSDVYSLGVLLYELLTGTTPLDVQSLRERGFMALLQAIKESDPQKPSTRVSTAATAASSAAVRRADPAKLGAMLRGDLDWIVMRCLEKDRARRYDSAASLAEDIERHLTGQVVTAVPPSRVYRMRKFVRRHKGPVLAGSLVVVLLVLGIVGTTIGMTRAIDEADRAEREMARATEVKSVIKAMLMGITPEEAQGADTTQLKGIVDNAAGRLDAGEVDDPLIAAEMHLLLGHTYTAITEYELADRHLSRAIAIYERDLGRDSRQAAEASMQRGILRWQQGAFREARRIHEDALARLRAADGVARKTVIGEEINLGTTLWSLGDNERALEILSRAREEAERELGAHDEFTMNAMENQALVLQSLHRHDESLPLLEELIATQIEVLGPDDLDTVATRTNYASALLAAERPADAERVLRDVYDRLVQIVGPEHPRTLAARVTLAGVYLRSGRDAEAEKELLAIREIAGRTLDPEHGINLSLHDEFAQVYQQQGSWGRSADELLQGIAKARRVLGDRDLRTLGNASDATELLMRVARHAEALELARYAAAAFTEIFGPDHERTVIGRARLAAAESHAGNPHEAEQLAREVIAQIEAQAEPPGRMLRYVHGSLIRALARQGRRDEAAAHMDQVTSALKDTDDNAARFLREMGELRGQWGQLAEAETLLRRALDIGTRMDGAKAAQTLDLKSVLASHVRAQGRHAEALRLYVECTEGLREVMGLDHALTIETTVRQALQHGALQQFDEAERLLLDATARADRVLGRDHMITVFCYRTLGMVYMDSRRVDDARRVLQIAVDAHAAVTGEPAAEDVNRLATIAAYRGEMPAAEKLFAQAADIAERTLGPAHDTTLDCANRHADCLLRLGRIADSAGRYERTLELTRGALPATHPRRVAAATGLLGIRSKQKRTSATVPLLELQLESLGGLREGCPPNVIQAAVSLASAYGTVGRFGESRDLLAKAQEVAAPGSPSYGVARLIEASLMHTAGMWNEAEAAAREAHDVLAATLGPTNAVVSFADAIRASTLLERGNVDEAIAALEAVRAALAAAVPAAHSFRQFTDVTLVEALHRAGRAQDAVPLVKGLVEVLGPLAEQQDAERETLDWLAICLLRKVSSDTYDPARALSLAMRAADLEERDAGGTLWRRKLTVAKARLHAGETERAEKDMGDALERAPHGQSRTIGVEWRAERKALGLD